MAIRFSYQTLGWHGPLEQTLGEIAALGFEGVELFDLLDRVEHKEDVAGLLRQAGLELAAGYMGSSFVEQDRLPSEFRDFDDTASAVAQLGGHLVVVGGGRLMPGREDADRRSFIRTLDKLGRRAQAAGVQMVLHPHCGALISTPEEIAAVAAETDPEHVKFAFDVAHLALAGGKPLALLGEHLDRVAYVHLKDAKSQEFIELGQGDIPLVDFFRVLRKRGYDGWVTVELDASEDPSASARANARFVREKLGAKLLRPPSR